MTAAAATVWVSGIFAAVFAGMALFFAVRLLAVHRDTWGSGGGTDRSAEASHGLMSLGMAAMFWPWGNPMPAQYWQVLFSIVAAWFVVRLLRRAARTATILPSDMGRGADLHQVLGNLAMVYMLAGVPAGAHLTHGMEMPGPGIALPALAWVFVAYFLLFAVWLGVRLIEPVNTVAATATGAALLSDGPRGVVSSPHLLGSSRIVMGIGMSCMLVTML